MILVRRLVLDILKPHKPNCLDFGKAVADIGSYNVTLTVIEKDDQTETVQAVIKGNNIDFESIQSVITDLGASLHSIDEVEVEGESEPTS